MTAFAGPRIATRATTARRSERTTFRSVRGSLAGIRGAFRASAGTRGTDYADALLLGRN
jgi:hypothetical protein